jgi:hypothetical protein
VGNLFWCQACDLRFSTGGLVSETYPSGRVISNDFDDAARLAQITSGGTTYAKQYDYSSSPGFLKSLVLGSGPVESYTYNSRLQMSSIDHTKGGPSISTFEDRSPELNGGRCFYNPKFLAEIVAACDWREVSRTVGQAPLIGDSFVYEAA